MWDEEYAIAGDFAQAACPVQTETEDGGWVPTIGGKQVADYQHSPAAAMRDLLEDVCRASGDDPEDEATAAMIEEAVAKMAEYDDQPAPTGRNGGRDDELDT